MVRKQILITPDQNRRLKARAAETGIPETEVVRHGIELALQAESEPGQDWRARLEKLLAEEPLGEEFAERMRQSKQTDAKAWRRRMARTRRLLADM
jgi:hypothetical protein